LPLCSPSRLASLLGFFEVAPERLVVTTTSKSVAGPVREETLAGSMQVSLWALLGVILIATALCIGMMDLSSPEVKALPIFLAVPYQWGGPAGVAFAVICLGCLIIAVGLLNEYRAIRRRQHSPRAGIIDLADALHLKQSTGAGSSFMELETSKYMGAWSATEPAATPYVEPLPEAEPQDSHI
jgi:hypothetical protein